MTASSAEQAAANNADIHEMASREWIRILSKYREPSTSRSIYELLVTMIPLMVGWGAATWLLQHCVLAALAMSVLNGLLVVRLFIIQHDCGHRAYFSSQKLMDWTGRLLGAFTVTPYAIWRHCHNIHHAHTGDLDKRGLGDVHTMTLEEYEAASTMERLKYKAYRHPLFLFFIAPTLLFVLQQRLPVGFWDNKKFVASAILTNLGIAAILGVFYTLGGWQAIALVWLPSIAVGASIGVWLFYVQHQFEDTYWDWKPEWNIHDAALRGSSHYILPQPIKWFSGNIGIHHVHHLYARIPFYRLPEVLRENPKLDEAQRLTVGESIWCARRHIWDPKTRRLMTFPEARQSLLGA
jgi:omega-6 fatty acid desaturase (delta-12 desaturase)